MLLFSRARARGGGTSFRCSTTETADPTICFEKNHGYRQATTGMETGQIIIDAHVFGGHVGGGGDGEEGGRDGVVGHEFEDLLKIYILILF